MYPHCIKILWQKNTMTSTVREEQRVVVFKGEKDNIIIKGP